MLGTPLTFTVGADADRQHEHRQGFVNNNGALGDLRRDEDDTVESGDGYAEAEWHALPSLSLTAGVRSSQVAIRLRRPLHHAVQSRRQRLAHVQQHQPDPRRRLARAPDLNLYASYGQGFETPTFAEMAYDPLGPGSTSRSIPRRPPRTRSALKALIAGKHRLNVALFQADTEDEIVIDTATGGRTTYQERGQHAAQGRRS